MLYMENHEHGGFNGKIICKWAIWWVVEPTPLKNMSSSIETLKFPTSWNNRIHVPVTTKQVFNVEHVQQVRINLLNPILGTALLFLLTSGPGWTWLLGQNSERFLA